MPEEYKQVPSLNAFGVYLQFWHSWTMTSHLILLPPFSHQSPIISSLKSLMIFLLFHSQWNYPNLCPHNFSLGFCKQPAHCSSLLFQTFLQHGQNSVRHWILKPEAASESPAAVPYLFWHQRLVLLWKSKDLRRSWGGEASAAEQLQIHTKLLSLILRLPPAL